MIQMLGIKACIRIGIRWLMDMMLLLNSDGIGMTMKPGLSFIINNEFIGTLCLHKTPMIFLMSQYSVIAAV